MATRSAYDEARDLFGQLKARGAQVAQGVRGFIQKYPTPARYAQEKIAPALQQRAQPTFERIGATAKPIVSAIQQGAAQTPIVPFFPQITPYRLMQFQAPLERQTARLPSAVHAGFPITQVPGYVGETVRQTGRFTGLQPTSLDVALNVGPALAGVRINNARAQQAVKLLRDKITKKDVATIGEFAELVETGRSRRNLQDLGRTIHSLAQNVFGRQAANWSNTQIKNAFDLVLGKIGQAPNIAGLGLQARPLRSIQQAEKQAKRAIPPSLQPLAQEAIETSGGYMPKGVIPKIEKELPEAIKGEQLARMKGVAMGNLKGNYSIKNLSILEELNQGADKAMIKRLFRSDYPEDILNNLYKNLKGDLPNIEKLAKNRGISVQELIRQTRKEMFDTRNRVAADFYTQATGGVGGAPRRAISPTAKARLVGKTAGIEGGARGGAVDPFVAEMEAQVGKTPKVIPKPPPIEVPSDIASQQVASVRGGSATGTPADDVISAFRDWVNARRATKAEGLVKSREFQDLNAKGMQGVFEFQAGKKTGRLGEVKKFFDARFDELTKAGVDMNYKQDYLPQLWANTQDEIDKVFGRTLSKRPSFTFESLIKNYQEGINAGLTPRYRTISELVGWYESRANRALADTKFFQFLGENGMIGSRVRVPRDWIPLDPSRFPARTIKTDKGVFSGQFYAPPEVGSMINNYLRSPDPNTANMYIQNIANFVSSAKNRLLSFGIPGTGINFHGFNILARSYLEGGPRGAIKTAYYMVNPRAAGKYVETNLAKTPEAIKSGLTISTHEYLSPLEDDKFLSRFGRTWNQLFEKPLFENIIAAKKLEAWERVRQDYARFMPKKEAKGEAAHFVNTLYGGINWEELGRDRNLQNIFRVIALTPDWLESNIRLGGNLVKSLLSPTNPTGRAYRRAMTHLVGSYIGLNLINKMTSGHWIFENDPGHTFELETGYTKEGQKRYYRPFGTAVDFVRIPTDVTISLLKGDPTPAFRAVGNRLSTIVSPIVHLLGNVNWAGQPIYQKDKYGKEIPPLQSALNIGTELGTTIGIPSFAGQFLRGVSGQQGLEQTLTQGFELPFRYAGGYFSPTDKEVAQSLGLQGKERYDLSKTLKDQAAFSEKQRQTIQAGGRAALSQIIQGRKSKKRLDTIREATPEQLAKLAIPNPTINETNALKKRAVEFYIQGKKDDTLALVRQYNFTLTPKEVAAAKKQLVREAADEYVADNKDKTLEMVRTYKFTLSKQDVLHAAKKRAIREYKAGNKDETLRLVRQYGFTLRPKDIE